MLYTQDRTQQRKFLANAWQKFLNKQPLDPLEAQLTQIIKIHPEYHSLIQNIESDFFPESGEVNPFLHINLTRLCKPSYFIIPKKEKKHE